MWIRICSVVWLTLLAGVFFHAAYAESPESRPVICWQADLKQAHSLAVREKRPILIVFRADWCHWCRQLESRTLSDAGLGDEISRSFVPVKLDIGRDREIADILGVERIPCTVILSHRADLLCRMPGLMKPDQYRRVLDQADRLQRHLEHRRVQVSTAHPAQQGTGPRPAPASPAVADPGA